MLKAPRSISRLAVVAFWHQHSLDHIDVKAVKNAESSVDMLHHNVLLDLSQNVHMTDLINRAGVTSCLTPGGKMFHFKRGREISGYEKLLLSGIPADSLLLGGESEVQLSDLAGNAMSMPVVSACMLAALCIQPYVKSRDETRLVNDKKKDGKQSYKAILTLPAPLKAAASGPQASSAAAASKAAADSKQYKPFSFASRACMASRAERCSIMCTCESSGDVSKNKILRCACCALTTCGMCQGKLQLETHRSMTSLYSSCAERFEGGGAGGLLHAADDAAAAPDEFEKELRREVPDVLCFQLPVGGVGIERFRLTRIERGRGHVTLRYVQYHEVDGTASAVLLVSLGRLEAPGTQGLKAVLFDLATGQRGPLSPVARLLVPAAASSSAVRAELKDGWEVSAPLTTSLGFATAEHAGTTPSFRSEMGLLDFENEVWPKQIVVGGPGTGAGGDVAGTYTREDCRGTMAFGALWKREAADGEQGMWLFIDPDVDRTGSDRLVFATTPTYLDGRAHHVAELLLAEEEPVLEWLHELGQRAKGEVSAAAGSSSKVPKGKAKKQKVDAAIITVSVRLLRWKEQPAIALCEPMHGPLVCQQQQQAVGGQQHQAVGKAKKSSSSSSEASGGSAATVNAAVPSFVVRDLPHSTLAKLREQSTNGQLSILSASSTVAERRLAESLSAPLLRFNLPTTRGELARRAGEKEWGRCETSAPSRPPERWGDDGRRTYETEDSNKYERAMSARPPAWDVTIGGGEVVISPQVGVVAHQAAEKLLRGRGLAEEVRGAMQIKWTVGARLDASRALPNFPIPTSKHDPDSKQPPALAWDSALKLYARQIKVKSWMEAIEEGKQFYDECDCTDAVLPGVGWQVQAKASLSKPLRGGVLADALGAGKTVTVIALIAADISKARALKLSGAGSEERQLSRASLIVVTPLIIRQWEKEIARFSAGKLTCVRIESASQLQALSVKQLREVDIVLVVSDLLGCAGKAAKYSKVVEAKGDEKMSVEVRKEFERNKQRLVDMKASDAEAKELAKDLDGRSDIYLNLLTEKAGTSPLPPFLHRRNQVRESGIGDHETTIYGVWITKSSRDPYGKVKGRQEDREAAAFFSHSYARVALPALRAKTFKDSDRGVPIEYFKWRRVIVDECHEPLCMGVEDADEAAISSKRSSCAVRELLGIALPDVESRPLLAQRGTFGLTGTPLLSSVARITELASLCAGTYVTGASAHWRTVERASSRDLFLRYHDSVATRLYQSESVRAAQEFVRVATRRNVVEEDQNIKCAHKECVVRLKANSPFERRVDVISRSKDVRVNGLCPDSEAIGETTWLELAQLAAEADERIDALHDCVKGIHKAEPLAKVLVFAPSSGFGKAKKAVEKLGATLKVPTTVITPGENQEAAAMQVLAFDEPPPLEATSYYRTQCRVLLLAYEDGAGLNLQHGCHHVVLYAPLAGHGSDQEQIISAVGKEQQSIGRVRRAGQTQDVTVHRIMLDGPRGERTLDRKLCERNQDKGLISRSTNIGDDS